MSLYRYLPALETVALTEAWAEGEGLVILAAETGPDGRIRGLATTPDVPALDLEVRARALRLNAEAGR